MAPPPQKPRRMAKPTAGVRTGGQPGPSQKAAPSAKQAPQGRPAQSSRLPQLSKAATKAEDLAKYGTAEKPIAVKPISPKKKAPPLRVLRAEYIASVKGIGEVPAGHPEIAVVGRSNVGKSSLINAMCNHQGLARTSKTPGRTQSINLFDATLSSGQVLRLVDLPGFGHAEVSKKLLGEFSEMIQFFLLASEHIKLVLILQDSRRDRDDDAIGFAQWLRDNHVPFDVVATKADEVPKTKIGSVIYRMQHEFGLARPALAVSVRDGRGVDDLLVKLRNAAFTRSPAKKAAGKKT